MDTFYSRVHWREFVVGDVAEATAFFRRVMGWTIETMAGSDDYQVARLDEHTLGGFTLASGFADSGVGPGMIHYMSTDDLDAAAARAVAAGGVRLTDRTETPGVGAFSLFRDPGGAPHYLIQPEDMTVLGPDPTMAFNRWFWTEGLMGDLDACMAYYNSVCNWTFTRNPVLSHPYYEISRETIMAAFGGLMAAADAVEADVPPHWITYIGVENIDAMLEETVKAGGTVSVGPWEIAGLGHTAIICEPTGAYAQLFQVAAEVRGDPMHQ